MLAGKSGEEKTIWCYRLWRVILLELNMLTLTMCGWTFQINSMRTGALVCLIVDGWFQNLGGMSWRSIHCPWHQDELGVFGIEEETCVTTVVICGYVHIGVYGCVWVVVLGVLLWGTICLCRVNKVVMNTVGLGVGWQRFGWPDGGECGVVGNNVPISVYDGCELFVHVWERGYNGRGKCWSLHLVFVGITGNCGCGSRLFLCF